MQRPLDGLAEGPTVSPQLSSRFRTLYPHAVGACVESGQLSTKVAGGAEVYQGVLDRCLRNILTVNQHLLASHKRYELAGRLVFEP